MLEIIVDARQDIVTIRTEQDVRTPLTFGISAATCGESLAAATEASTASKAHLARFEKVVSDGKHIATIDHDSGLMYAATSITSGGEMFASQQACIDVCAALEILGYRDWRLATRAEAIAIVDDTRHEPAVDPEYFPGIKPSWHWTSTPAAWSSASAWSVNFSNGYVGSYPRDNYGFALAVRRAGQ